MAPPTSLMARFGEAPAPEGSLLGERIRGLHKPWDSTALWRRCRCGFLSASLCGKPIVDGGPEQLISVEGLLPPGIFLFGSVIWTWGKKKPIRPRVRTKNCPGRGTLQCPGLEPSIKDVRSSIPTFLWRHLRLPCLI